MQGVLVLVTCELPHIARPCSECPWRTDAQPQKFAAERYEALQATSNQSGLYAPLFACHMTKEGREQACAGWLAVAGVEHLGVRLALIQGRLDPAALRPGPGWPDLHDSYEALVAHQGYEEDA